MTLHFVGKVDGSEVEIDPDTGARVRSLSNGVRGAVHLGSAVFEIDSGVPPRTVVNPHEEAFFVRSGTLRLTMAGSTAELHENDYGLVPYGAAHTWEAASDSASWLSVKSPQPSDAVPSRARDGAVGRDANTVEDDRDDLIGRYLGRFDPASLPPPGDQQLAGYHGSGVNGVSIEMLVDAQFGAQHMNMFVVQFAPGGRGEVHDHPYEESYLLLEGSAVALVDGERYQVTAGDFVWTSVGGTHGFFNEADRPVRWIETQTPQPPRQNGHRFIADWAQ